ncbi:CAAD domain-containing protein [Oscillatoria sp. CS-180]|uniref:CAAD domain-containing protein n=1 Tax=Oscillatoria sp. CS-180 TaxID=3021720 RepID=UPI00232F9D27|nr:CAAD domain-containing protein [Oscillatoria sp. CS-180]MDB9526212.1 CAAD domain-containing protein [Oscillatoria sp. CS-180]
MSTDINSETTVPEVPKVPETDYQSVHTETIEDEETNPQVQEILDKVSGVLANLPDYVTDFFKEYQRPLITVGLILTAFVSVKLLLAILHAVNEVPLLAPTFELIGLGYSGWFVYRFLLKDVNRQELTENFTSLKDQVLGKRI